MRVCVRVCVSGVCVSVCVCLCVCVCAPQRRKGQIQSSRYPSGIKGHQGTGGTGSHKDNPSCTQASWTTKGQGSRVPLIVTHETVSLATESIASHLTTSLGGGGLWALFLHSDSEDPVT